jgi:murein DD-endopeptidase MepM/ murein hydrolase activator NlpD
MIEKPPVSVETDDFDAGDLTDDPENMQNKNPFRNWEQVWEGLLRIGLGETTLRLGTGVISVVLALLVVWVMGNFYLKGDSTPGGQSAIAAPLPTATAPIAPPQMELPDLSGAYLNGITRMAQLRTVLPSRPRYEIDTYVVQPGDTIFAISQKFNIEPETLLWSNYYILADDPHRLSPGQELIILPVNGVYYEWHAGDGLNGVANFYGVTADDIINWPGNNLSADTIGDMMNPDIDPGTWLVVPGGRREFITWSAPRITRDDPAVAKIFGPGACDAVYEGPVGTGTFSWPSVERYISGFHYSPETNHWGIDIGGKTGYAIFGADDGVVVYAGWNDWGYGFVVVIDHGNGWQSLYAHLSELNVGCGSYVYQGDVIGAMGSTGNSSGPHLHFELRSDEYGRPDPMNFLQ